MKGLLTILAWIQAQLRPIQNRRILANIPDVEVQKDWDGGESCDSKPSQHEDVGQHDELKEERRINIRLDLHFSKDDHVPEVYDCDECSSVDLLQDQEVKLIGNGQVDVCTKTQREVHKNTCRDVSYSCFE